MTSVWGGMGASVQFSVCIVLLNSVTGTFPSPSQVVFFSVEFLSNIIASSVVMTHHSAVIKLSFCLIKFKTRSTTSVKSVVNSVSCHLV